VVFIDIDQIAGGDDFVEAIRAKLESCDVLVAMIGPKWLDATDPDGKPRVDNPGGFVRLEISSALSRGVRVIPVLVDKAQMPEAVNLPPDLQPLIRRQVVNLDYENFNTDAKRVIYTIDNILKKVAEEREALKKLESEKGRWKIGPLGEMSEQLPSKNASPSADWDRGSRHLLEVQAHCAKYVASWGAKAMPVDRVWCDVVFILRIRALEQQRLLRRKFEQQPKNEREIGTKSR
jgi:hypothetical protein